MTIKDQNEFIESLEGNISPEQLDQLLELGEGDTGAKPEQAAQPGAATAEGDDTTEGADSESTAAAAEAAAAEGKGTAKAQDSAGEPELNAENAVVLTRDGKHTIDYQKLVDARQGEQHWKSEAAAKDARIAELEAQANARVEAGVAPTKQDNQLAVAQAAMDQGVDPGIFGDFSEEALAKGIQTLVAQQVAAQVQEQVSKVMAPVQAKQASDAQAQHLNAIYEAHPDADSIAESKEFATWINSQPSMARDAYAKTLENGSTGEIIELFGAYKQATGATQGASAVADVKTKAQEAIAKASAAVPASLSDIAGGRAAGVTREEALAGMDGAELLENMDSMSREQIDQFLNRL